MKHFLVLSPGKKQKHEESFCFVPKSWLPALSHKTAGSLYIELCMCLEPVVPEFSPESRHEKTWYMGTRKALIRLCIRTVTSAQSDQCQPTSSVKVYTNFQPLSLASDLT